MNLNNLSPTKKHRLLEYFKCKKDKVYFMEQYIKLSLVGGDKSVKLYDKQKDFVKLVEDEHHVITLKTRQTGLSTIAQMLVAHLVTFHKNCVVGVISKSGAESTDFCRSVLSMIDSLPEWLRPRFVKRTEQSFILEDGSKFYASQVNDSNPSGVLRGKAINFLILDEAGFISKIDEAYTSCAPTLFKAQSVSKQENIPYGTLVISTPNKTVGKGKWYYQTWMSAKKGDSIFKPFKLHWKEIPEFADDPLWYKTQCRLLNNVQWKIDQELDMQFVASNNSFFDSDTITLLNKTPNEPLNNLKFYREKLNVFKRSEPDRFYLLGVDTASQGGEDSSAIEVCDFETLEQVAEYKSSKIRVDNFCEVVSKVSDIYPNNLIVVEANSYGNQVCEYLTGQDKYFNLYLRKEVSKVVNKKSKDPKYKYGIYTGSQNRPLIIDALYTYVSDNPSIINSESLALELIGLVDKSGKVQADEGEHDDLSLAYAFCCYIKLYDPPLGMFSKFTNSNATGDMSEIANWNNDDKITTGPILSKMDLMKTDDKFEELEQSNKLLSHFINSNLSKMDIQDGNVIDILEILNEKN